MMGLMSLSFPQIVMTPGDRTKTSHSITLSLLTPTELLTYLLIGTVSEEQFMQIIAGLHTYKEPTKKTPLFKFE
jgi:hypothetical protein